MQKETNTGQETWRTEGERLTCLIGYRIRAEKEGTRLRQC